MTHNFGSFGGRDDPHYALQHFTALNLINLCRALSVEGVKDSTELNLKDLYKPMTLAPELVKTFNPRTHILPNKCGSTHVHSHLGNGEYEPLGIIMYGDTVSASFARGVAMAQMPDYSEEMLEHIFFDDMTLLYTKCGSISIVSPETFLAVDRSRKGAPEVYTHPAFDH